MPKAIKRVLAVVGIVLAAFIVVVGGYAAYLTATYNRIDDNVPIEVNNNPNASLQTGKEYTAVTYNIGFGAYTPEFTFFMDEGIMEDGTKTVGKYSKAKSRESVEACTQGDIDVLEELDPDFLLLQEVDTDSTRSFQVDQQAAIEDAFPDLSSAFATNFHSAYLAYPLFDHHGVVNSGLLLMGDAKVDSAIRRSYPVAEDFPTKFFDLDRCFIVERLPVAGGKDLVLIDSHMSAYDEGGVIRAQQVELIKSTLEQEAAQGNYVIAGGDWNHALCDSLEAHTFAQQVPTWVKEFEDESLPAGFSVVRATNVDEVSTCRGTDIPYEEDYTYTVTVDGFIVSDNVTATAENIDAEFQYSDHNPVKLTFVLE